MAASSPAKLPDWQADMQQLKAESAQWQSRLDDLDRKNGGHVVTVSADGAWARDFFGKSYHCSPLSKKAGDIVKKYFRIEGFRESYESVVCARLLRAVPTSEVRALWKLCRQKPRPPMATGKWWEVIAD